jgi:hypothetical protein
MTKKANWEKECNLHFFEPLLIKITAGLFNSKLQKCHIHKSEYSESHTAEPLFKNT